MKSRREGDHRQVTGKTKVISVEHDIQMKHTKFLCEDCCGLFTLEENSHEYAFIYKNSQDYRLPNSMPSYLALKILRRRILVSIWCCGLWIWSY